ncbi:translation initiation factor IF-2 subunit gamma [Candidatus Parvarchaeota archaeon]|nr:translation initiation factor IF-2 subunit gamma [Candidatus Parvarchaeota archaeon]
MLGHVDHGKTSLTRMLTGKWTDTHSEELKRGITIKIGYADASFYKCLKCKPAVFSAKEECPSCKSKSKLLRRVSFLDAPGHETLMTTAISASSIIDGAILVIAANEHCPQPQTAEHMSVIEILGIKNIVIIQNKVDLVSKEKAMENYKQIKNFTKGTVAQNAPVIPISANNNVNLDSVIEAIEEYVKTPKRSQAAKPLMYVTRSFDINKPGSSIESIKGGVIGGSLIQGSLKVGDTIELRPGITKKLKDSESVEPVILSVSELHCSEESVQSVGPGGLIGIGTTLDPSITKSDTLVGNLVGHPGSLPDVKSEIEVEPSLLKRTEFENVPFKPNDPVVLSVGTATTIGLVLKTKANRLYLKLKRPICASPKSKLALSRRIGQRWRLCGYGILV